MENVYHVFKVVMPKMVLAKSVNKTVYLVTVVNIVIVASSRIMSGKYIMTIKSVNLINVKNVCSVALCVNQITHVYHAKTDIIC